jgi:predicted O-methyltransferase YrrM
MGSAWGLSTSILCQAVADSGRAAQVISLEIDPTFHQQTVQQIAQLHLTPYLQAHQCDASEFSSILIEKKQSFGLAFIDHCHSYQATGIACQQLRKLMAPNGFVLFHDFNDERNRLDFPTFGVYQGVIENFAENDFIFSGLFGCTALYRKRGQLKFK